MHLCRLHKFADSTILHKKINKYDKSVDFQQLKWTGAGLQATPRPAVTSFQLPTCAE